MRCGRGACVRELYALCVLACVLALAPGTHAADAIDIAAAVGFSDTFRPGHWTPLTVTVTNHGPDIDGELEVQVTREDAARGRLLATLHRRTLELRRGTRKSLHFTLLPQGLFHPLVIRVRESGRELARTEVDLRTRFAPQRLLVALSRDVRFDFLNDGAVDGVRVLYPHPELMPRHWRGYDAVAAVVVHGVSLERLAESQIEALRKWIAQGGVFAVSGGPDRGLLKSPQLAALLPGVPSGMTQVDPAALEEAFPGLPAAAQPLYVHRLGALRGSVRLDAGGTPLVVERPFGRGRVLYLTFDVAAPPFDRWPGMRALLLEQLRLQSAASAALDPAAPASGDALGALIRTQAPDFPRYSVVLLFVVLYLGLLYAGHAIPEERSRSRWSAVAWFGAPLAFAPLAWLLFGPAAFPRGASSAIVALIEPLAGSGYARLGLEIALYAHRTQPLRFEYRGADPALRPHRQAQRAGTVGDWIFGMSAQPYAEARNPQRYRLHRLEGTDVIAFRLDARLEPKTAGPHLTVHNATGRKLEGVWLVYDGRAYDLGTVASGARLERQLSAAAAVPVGPESWRPVLKPPPGVPSHAGWPAQFLLERRAKAPGGFPPQGHALLLGYTASPLRPAGASAEWPRQEQTLLAFEFAAAADAAATEREPGPVSGNGKAMPPASFTADAARARPQQGTEDAKQPARH